MNRRSKAGFTLVELMVVAIIVAILAAVAIPLFSANKKRAIATEAQAGLGSMRTAMRVILAEHGAYNVGVTVGKLSSSNSIPGMANTDLNGRYFTNTDYEVESVSSNAYSLKCSSSVGDAAGITIKLDDGGNWTGVP